MNTEYYGAPSTPTSDFLAHYGVKGMKWGVRRAIQKGNDRALSRQYKKAQKKLAKLEKLGANGKQYAKKAAKYGAGAALAGTVAAAGPAKAISSAVDVGGKAMVGAGQLASKLGMAAIKSNSKAVRNIGKGLSSAGRTVSSAGYNTRIHTAPNVSKEITNWGTKEHNIQKALKIDNSSPLAAKINGAKVSNKTLARVGAGAVGAGLGIAAAKNAYRAANAKKRAQQAREFRAEMNKAFAGTKYATGRSVSQKKRRRG